MLTISDYPGNCRFFCGCRFRTEPATKAATAMPARELQPAHTETLTIKLVSNQPQQEHGSNAATRNEPTRSPHRPRQLAVSGMESGIGQGLESSPYPPETIARPEGRVNIGLSPELGRAPVAC
jgi:hypothetical protein